MKIYHTWANIICKLVLKPSYNLMKLTYCYTLSGFQVFVEDLDRKYKTLDPRSRISDLQHNPTIHSYNSLERATSRRKLPNVPNPQLPVSSHSLPRPSKQKQWRDQSESKSRERNVDQVTTRSLLLSLTVCNIKKVMRIIIKWPSL